VARTMTPRPGGTLLRQLLELVEALDRRVPSLHDAGEARIAKDAAALRAAAQKRIRQLEALAR
jgi:hypothetical protein